MTVITFDDNLITGNKTIDEQHKELIDRIQQFVSACESEDARVKAIKMLDYLDEYTEFHFKEEEKLQKDVDYPGLEEHIKKHEEFRHTVKVLYDYLDENEGPDEKFMEQVKINVIDWLFGHIKTFDRSVAEYINIYELAHKCKEWALDNRWIISTMPMLTEKRWRNTSVRLSHFYNPSKDRYLDGIYHNGRIEADTETEAIFKACQWILDKDSK